MSGVFKAVYIFGILLTIIGLILLFSAISVEGSLPSAYNTFLGIPYSVNSAFVSQFNEIVLLVISGMFILGGGLGMVFSASMIRANQLRSQIPPITQSTQQPKIYCGSCGKENPYENTFCFYCGKKIVRV